jgi:hypothetical protein
MGRQSPDRQSASTTRLHGESTLHQHFSHNAVLVDRRVMEGLASAIDTLPCCWPARMIKKDR